MKDIVLNVIAGGILIFSGIISIITLFAFMLWYGMWIFTVLGL